MADRIGGFQPINWANFSSGKVDFNTISKIDMPETQDTAETMPSVSDPQTSNMMKSATDFVGMFFDHYA